MLEPASSLDRRRPFTRAQALAAGIRPGALAGRAFVKLFHGVYAYRTLEITPCVWTEAALLVHPPTAYASHSSAARVYELPIPVLPGEHVTVRCRSDRRRPGTFHHHLAPSDPDVRVIRGIRVSAPEQLFCELAELLGLVDLVVAGDALVRRYNVDPARLMAVADRAPRSARSPARRAAAYVRRDVDSPMETRVRMLLVLAGLPEPQVNVKVRWPDGRVRYRFDLCYPEWKLVIEYDGRQHRDDLDQWDRDIGRRDWMDAEGWSFVPVVARGVYRRPDETIERVCSALARAGATLPRRLSEDWRAHFPVLG